MFQIFWLHTAFPPVSYADVIAFHSVISPKVHGEMRARDILSREKSVVLLNGQDAGREIGFPKRITRALEFSLQKTGSPAGKRSLVASGRWPIVLPLFIPPGRVSQRNHYILTAGRYQSMDVHREHINDYPFVAFPHWGFCPLELVQMYADCGGSNSELIDAVTRLDPLYVKYRALKRIESHFQIRLKDLDRALDSIAEHMPEFLPEINEMQENISSAKRALVESVKDKDLTEGRRSLLQIALFLKKEECIELIA